jgi:xanthine dehydrogenase YagS FAD-binding subunit
VKDFQFVRPRTSAEAQEALSEASGALLHAGGIDLLDRMKEGVAAPSTLVSLVDVQGLGGIEIDPSGDIRIGAGVTLAELAASEAVQRFLPSLAEAAGDAASPQLRNRATLGGNLMQHTRCGYFRLASFPCLKRGGTDCPVRAEGGVQEYAGVIGNEVCASAHPSSVAPVLGTLDAELLVRGGESVRTLAFADLWAAPRAGVPGDTTLARDEVIETIVIPARDDKPHVGHAEVRQKAAFDWALVTCSVRYALEGETIREARVWFGSLAPTPWRATKAEAALVGGPATDAAAEKAAQAALADATPLAGTAYKVQLAKVALKRALAAARERSS